MNRWLQTKEYTCPDCGTIYLHDKAYWHAAYHCPKRHEPVKPNTVQDVAHATLAVPT